MHTLCHSLLLFLIMTLVDGVAFHWYGGFLKNYDALQKTVSMFPQLPFLASEATLEARWKQVRVCMLSPRAYFSDVIIICVHAVGSLVARTILRCGYY